MKKLLALPLTALTIVVVLATTLPSHHAQAVTVNPKARAEYTAASISMVSGDRAPHVASIVHTSGTYTIVETGHFTVPVSVPYGHTAPTGTRLTVTVNAATGRLIEFNIR